MIGYKSEQARINGYNNFQDKIDRRRHGGERGGGRGRGRGRGHRDRDRDGEYEQRHERRDRKPHVVLSKGTNFVKREEDKELGHRDEVDDYEGFKPKPRAKEFQDKDHFTRTTNTFEGGKQEQTPHDGGHRSRKGTYNTAGDFGAHQDFRGGHTQGVRHTDDHGEHKEMTRGFKSNYNDRRSDYHNEYVGYRKGDYRGDHRGGHREDLRDDHRGAHRGEHRADHRGGHREEYGYHKTEQRGERGGHRGHKGDHGYQKLDQDSGFRKNSYHNESQNSRKGSGYYAAEQGQNTRKDSGHHQPREHYAPVNNDRSHRGNHGDRFDGHDNQRGDRSGRGGRGRGGRGGQYSDSYGGFRGGRGHHDRDIDHQQVAVY